MRGFYMDEAFTGSPSDLQHISHDTNFTAKQWVDNTSASLAPIEATSTASQPYTVGKRLVYGGRLYKVTQAIAQGGTLTPGTNITPDTVDEELSTISTHLTASNNVPFTFGYNSETQKYGYIINGTFAPFGGDSVAGKSKFRVGVNTNYAILPAGAKTMILSTSNYTTTFNVTVKINGYVGTTDYSQHTLASNGKTLTVSLGDNIETPRLLTLTTNATTGNACDLEIEFA